MTHYDRFDDIPRGAFSLVSADPPWAFKTFSNKGKQKSPDRHYSCMSLDELAELPVAEIAAPDCALFLWATAPMLQEGLAMMGAWGFTYKTCLVWGKTTKHGKVSYGLGFRIRNSHEMILLGVRGNPKNTRTERSLIMAGVRQHSRKPDEAAVLMERWLPDARRIDLFGGRTTRAGWCSFGDQPGLFDEVAA